MGPLRRVIPWLFVLCIAGGSQAAAGAPSVFLLLVDRLTVGDLLRPEAHGLRLLAGWGGVALANVRTGGGGPAAGYLSLGAGGRAAAGPAAGAAYGVREVVDGQTAGELFRALTGTDAPDGIVHLGIEELRRLAGQQPRPAEPGLLGEALRNAGIPVAVYGNADGHGVVGRFGVLVAMDAAGRVPAGDVSAALLTADPDWPFRMRTDYEALGARLAGHVGQPGLVVVELGDLARLEAIAGLAAPEAIDALRGTALERIGRLVEQLAALARTSGVETVIVVVAPSPTAPEAEAGFMLAPVIMARIPSGGAGAPEAPGWLTSGTTRRQGIIANVDVSATVLALFGAGPRGAGRPVRTVDAADPWTGLAELYERITRVHLQRVPLIQPYFFIQLGAVTGSALVAWGIRRRILRSSAWRRFLLAVHLILAAFPLALLVLPALPAARTLPALWLEVLAVSGLLAFVGAAGRRRHPAFPFTVLSLLTVALTAADLLTGARLMQASHLGYDPIGGSRYYGIGNEYMGVVLGCALIAAGGMLDAVSPRYNGVARWSVGAVFAFLSFLMASPAHGANVGGTISAVAGLGAALLMFRYDRLRARHLVLLAAAVAVAVAAAAWYDLSAGEGASHLGVAVRQAAAEGSDPLWQTVERKVAMNVRLIRLTVWSRAFLVSLLGALIFACYPGPGTRRLLRRYRYTGTAVRAAVPAACVALAVNDSGIVAAATLMIPVASVLMYLVVCTAAEEAPAP